MEKTTGAFDFSEELVRSHREFLNGDKLQIGLYDAGEKDYLLGLLVRGLVPARPICQDKDIVLSALKQCASDKVVALFKAVRWLIESSQDKARFVTDPIVARIVTGSDPLALKMLRGEIAADAGLLQVHIYLHEGPPAQKKQN